MENLKNGDTKNEGETMGHAETPVNVDMRMGRLRYLAGLTVIVVGLTGTVATCEPPDPTTYDWQEEIRVLFGLEQNEVEKGRLGFFLEENCPPYIEKYGTCFGNNPASPYGMYEFSDFNEPEDACRWRLAENQAVMFLGLTPPTGRYFSFQSYPFSRHRDNVRLDHDPYCPDAYCCDNQCGHGWFCDEWARDGSCLIERRQLAGMMGLNLNHLELLTDGGDEDSFGRFTVVVTTANQAIERRIRRFLPDRLAALGISPNIINIDPVPCVQAGAGGACDDSDPRNLVLGSEPNSDDFIMALRVSITESLAAQEAYLADPPATVLRVTFTDANGIFTPYPRDPEPALPDPELYNELPYEEALQWLAVMMRETYAPGGAILAFRPGGDDYYGCLQKEGPCYVGSEDAYYSKGPDLPKDCVGQGRSVYVVGVNHSLVGPYSYSSLSVREPERRHELGYFQDIPYVVPNYPNEPPPAEGVVPPYLAGSVEYFLPRAQYPRSDEIDGKLAKLYVAEISSSCDPAVNPHCLGVSVEDLIDPNLGFQERVYLNTIAGTGPWSENFILSRVIISEECKACRNDDLAGDADGVVINLPAHAVFAEEFSCTADIDGDGQAGLSDLKILAIDWLYRVEF